MVILKFWLKATLEKRSYFTRLALPRGAPRRGASARLRREKARYARLGNNAATLLWLATSGYQAVGSSRPAPP